MIASVDVITLPVAAGPETKQVLHIGNSVCTPAKLHPSFAGWHEIRLDSDAAVNPDIVSSPVHMPKVATGSVDAVYCFRGLQQLHAHELPAAFSEIRRVLKTGGHALLAVLDLAKIAPYLSSERLEEPIFDSAAGPFSALDLLFGHRLLIGQGKSQLANHTGFATKSFGSALVKAGFSEVRLQPAGFDLWAHAVKGAAQATSFTLLDPPAVPGEPAP
jgi:hypothetical protein